MDAGLLDRFVKESPVTVMARAVFEFGVSAERIDQIFRQHAIKQYEGELFFSCAVELLGLTVMKSRNSLREAYLREKENVGVTIKALYDKLANTELPVSRALVRETALQLMPVVQSLKAEVPPLLPGYRTKIIDGKHLGGTEHRIKETRTLHACPLPGHLLVVLDPQVMMAIDVVPWEDAYTQERKLLDEVLATADENDLWIADRNFCTTNFFFGLDERNACFAIRQHGSTLNGKRLVGRRRRVDRCETGVVYEQAMEIDNPPDGTSLTIRRITLELDKPTRDGEKEVHVLTNLPGSVGAVTVCDLYRRRWSVETAFQELGQSLDAEIDTLCYPRAALLAYCIALMMYNVLSVVKASLRSVHGEELLPEKISGYGLASEIKSIYGGLLIAIPPPQWREQFSGQTPSGLAKFLCRCSKQVNIDRFKKSQRGPKCPQPKRKGGLRQKHVSTARLLQSRKK